MIIIQTKILIKDNTGIKKAKCIKIFNKSIAKIGDIVLVSIKQLKSLNQKKIKIQKGDILKGIVIRIKYPMKNTIGHYIKFYENSIILMNNKNNLIGNRIFGPVISKFRLQKKVKILTLANYIL